MRMESSVFGDQSLLGYNSTGAAGASVSAPVSPVSSPTESRKLEKAFSLCRSRHDSVKSSDNTTTEHIQELEMLLEAYFVVIDSTLNKLTSVLIHISYIWLFSVIGVKGTLSLFSPFSLKSTLMTLKILSTFSWYINNFILLILETHIRFMHFSLLVLC